MNWSAAEDWWRVFVAFGRLDYATNTTDLYVMDPHAVHRPLLTTIEDFTRREPHGAEPGLPGLLDPDARGV